MSDMLDHALDYARRGWPVFPCNPSPEPGIGKRPLVGRDRDQAGNPVPNTGGLTKATTDEAQILAWWTRWPGALIGVPMGRRAGVFAIDPDVPKKPGAPDGVAAWQSLVAGHSGHPNTHTHLTPSGGLHVLFAWSGSCPVSNREGQLPAGIDVRGEGGYIIVPPSRLADGRSYELVESLDFFTFAEAPEWLLRLLAPDISERAAGQSSSSVSIRQNIVVLGSSNRPVRHSGYADAALEAECIGLAQAAPGTRNTALNRAAFSLGTLVGTGALDANRLRAGLLEAATACGLLADDSEAAVLATIESGLRAGQKRPRDIPASGSGRRTRGTGASSGAAVPSSIADHPGPEQGIITQDAVALAFAERYRDRLRFCHDTGAWFAWTGTHWQRDETDLAFQFARQLGREASTGSDLKELKEVRKVTFASGVERFARGDRVFAVTIEAWDRDPFLLGTPGGTVDLRSADLRASEPSDGITRLAAVAPSAEATCPLWRRFLDEVTGDDHELIRFLQQWCGYALTGSTREHALVFVHGPGGNGKSVFLNVLTGVLGAYATTAAMDTFAACKSDRHPTDLAMLRGARLVTASETEEGRAWAEARIKQMTGGDPVSARFMRQDFFTYVPQFKLTIVGNHKPVLHNVDDAARRRFNIVPFTRKPERPDRQLEEKLKPEWPAILRWMIEGCLDWQKNGLVRPDSVIAATAAYFDAQDLLGQWLEEECDAEPGNPYKIETTGVLFESWSGFADRAGERAGSKKSFSEQLQRRGFEAGKGTGGVRLFRGLRMRPARSTVTSCDR